MVWFRPSVSRTPRHKVPRHRQEQQNTSAGPASIGGHQVATQAPERSTATKWLQLVLCFAVLIVALLNTLIWTRPAFSTNLIENQSVEAIGQEGLPTGWRNEHPGSMTAAFDRDAGPGGRHSLHVKVSDYGGGTAYWYFAQLPTGARDGYIFADRYRATIPSDTTVRFRDDCGRETYIYLGTSPASADWRSTEYFFEAPSDGEFTVMHSISGNGELWTADFSVKAVAPGWARRAPTPQPPGVSNEPGPDILGDLPHAPPTSPPGPPPPDWLIANGSAETADPNNPNQPLGWKPNSWGTSTPRFEYAADGHGGARSLKVSISDYTDGDAKWVFAPVALDPNQDYEFTDYYRSTTLTKVVAAVTTTAGATDYLPLPDAPAIPGWAHYAGVFSMPADGATVTIYHLLDSNGTLQTDDYAITQHVVQGFNRGLLSLTFDDASRNIYTNGLPVLTKYAMPSTQYLITGLTRDASSMTVDMMRAFQNQGSELASHTVTHPHLPQIPESCLDDQLEKSQAALRQWFGPAAGKNFAPPYGELNDSVLTWVKRLYRSSRGIDAGYNEKNTFDVYNIKVQNVTAATGLDEIQAWIAKALAEKLWLVIVYHEVSDTPTDPDLAVSPANLDAQLNLIQSSGIPVMTVNQALDELTPQL
jgi:hypothetical protein